MEWSTDWSWDEDLIRTLMYINATLFTLTGLHMFVKIKPRVECFCYLCPLFGTAALILDTYTEHIGRSPANIALMCRNFLGMIVYKRFNERVNWQAVRFGDNYLVHFIFLIIALVAVTANFNLIQSKSAILCVMFLFIGIGVCPMFLTFSFLWMIVCITEQLQLLPPYSPNFVIRIPELVIMTPTHILFFNLIPYVCLPNLTEIQNERLLDSSDEIDLDDLPPIPGSESCKKSDYSPNAPELLTHSSTEVTEPPDTLHFNFDRETQRRRTLGKLTNLIYGEAYVTFGGSPI